MKFRALLGRIPFGVVRDALFALGVIALLTWSQWPVVATAVKVVLYVLMLSLIAIDYIGETLVGGGPVVAMRLSLFLPASVVCELLLVPTTRPFLGLLETVIFLLILVQCSGALFWDGLWSERRHAYGAWLILGTSLFVAIHSVTPAAFLVFIAQPVVAVVAAFAIASVLLLYAAFTAAGDDMRWHAVAAFAAVGSFVLASADLLAAAHRINAPAAFTTIAPASCAALYVLARLAWSRPVPETVSSTNFVAFTFAAAFLLVFFADVYANDIDALHHVLFDQTRFESWLVGIAAVLSILLSALLLRFRRSEEPPSASARANGRRSRTDGRSSAPVPRGRAARSSLPR
jgi:hypothetical protein